MDFPHRFILTVLTLVLVMTLATAQYIPSLQQQQRTRAAADQLMTSYDQSTGSWYDGSHQLWWNSANMLTAMIDLFKIDSTIKDKYDYIIATTYVNASASNPNVARLVTSNRMYAKEYTRRSDADIARRTSKRYGIAEGFLNSFYDDEGWWALGWIDAYDFTGNSSYLDTAKAIWTDMKGGETTPCGAGGIWWDRNKKVVASISNELFLATSAALAVRTEAANRKAYLDAAVASLNFLQSHNLIGTDNLVVDQLDKDCKATGPKWSYNQGVILGGLIELTKVTGNNSYLDLATRIAGAATANNSSLVTNGILHEANNCEKMNGCGNDGDQFKGIFVRNLRKLHQTRPNPTWKQFLDRNAESIWANDRSGIATLGPNWAGPYVGNGKAIAQSSALECLIASEATT